MELTRTQTSNCLYNDLIASKTDLSRHTPAVVPITCFLEHGHTLFQGLQSMCTPLWHIPTISQNLAGGQKSSPWWICQDKIRIVHTEVEVRLFHNISFKGTLYRPTVGKLRLASRMLVANLLFAALLAKQ